MKRITISLLTLAVAGGALWMFKNRTEKSPSSFETYLPPSTPPDTTLSDPKEVFQRAFWKRPTPADKILHAERREWKDQDAVSRWQWFLEVEPSPEIVRHLREDNAFRLSQATSATLPSETPAWFLRDTTGSQILTSRDGGMQLIFTADDTKIFAMGSGGGFIAGAPEQAPAPVRTANIAGRIPPTSPILENQ